MSTDPRGTSSRITRLTAADAIAFRNLRLNGLREHPDEGGLHRVSLRVLASNPRAIIGYRKCGFIEEGREREAAFVGGAWQDDIIMGLLDREFVSR